METQDEQTGAGHRNHERDEELVDVLLAISVVSKRLARKLGMLTRQDKQQMKGGKADEQVE